MMFSEKKSVSFYFSSVKLHNWDHTKLCWQKVLFLQQTSSGVTLNHYSGAFSWPPPLHFHQKGLDLATGNDTAIQTVTSVSYVWPKFHPNESFVFSPISTRWESGQTSLLSSAIHCISSRQSK